jgi:hypothetical protein
MNSAQTCQPSHRLVPAMLSKTVLLLAFTFAVGLGFMPSAFGAVAPDADRTFLHPAENNQTKNLTLTSGNCSGAF